MILEECQAIKPLLVTDHRHMDVYRCCRHQAFGDSS